MLGFQPSSGKLKKFVILAWKVKGIVIITSVPLSDLSLSFKEAGCHLSPFIYMMAASGLPVPPPPPNGLGPKPTF